MNTIDALISFVLGCLVGVLIISSYIPTPEPDNTNKVSAKKYNEIKSLYENRTIQLKTEQLNWKQYRDSLYTDLETYMIINR